jgi:hypothetical protein
MISAYRLPYIHIYTYIYTRDHAHVTTHTYVQTQVSTFPRNRNLVTVLTGRVSIFAPEWPVRSSRSNGVGVIVEKLSMVIAARGELGRFNYTTVISGILPDSKFATLLLVDRHQRAGAYLNALTVAVIHWPEISPTRKLHSGRWCRTTRGWYIFPTNCGTIGAAQGVLCCWQKTGTRSMQSVKATQ